ncbi:MAG: hypothetical protein ABI855_16410, partial [Bacteroidota bacterium]
MTYKINKEKSFSQLTSCGHCSNISQMEIIGNVNHWEELDEKEYDGSQGYPPEQGIIYLVLRCPACKKTNIVSYFYHGSMEDVDVSYENIYPPDKNIPIGLP